MSRAIFAVCITALCSAGAFYVMRRRRSVKLITRDQFLCIMKEISLNAFDVLFEYAQMASRVSMTSKVDIKSFLEQDSHLRHDLEHRQEIILKKYDVDVTDLVNAQSIYSDTEADAIVKSVPDMYEQSIRGEFPLLEWLPDQATPFGDDELLIIVTHNLRAKTEHVLGKTSEAPSDLPATTKNSLSRRINNDEIFRSKLFEVVLKAQNEVRSLLS